MTNIKDIIRKVSELPVEDRAMVIDSLLRTLNMPNPKIDQVWSETAKHRLAELRSNRVRPIPGNEVFSRIKERFVFHSPKYPVVPECVAHSGRKCPPLSC